MIREAEQILERLPELLREKPELRYRLWEVISEEFPSRREMERLLAELAAMREESNRRFEASERRFEAFQADVDRRFDAFQADMDHRFETFQADVDRRFDAVLAELAAQRADLADVKQGLADLKHYVNVHVGGLQRRTGRNLEDMVAGALRIALGRTDLRAEHVRLRQHVEDRDGLIGPAGRRYEYDILAINGHVCVFEVKSAPDEEDVDRFRDKCDLVERELGRGPIERVLATLAKTARLKRYCAARGVTLI